MWDFLDRFRGAKEAMRRAPSERFVVRGSSTLDNSVFPDFVILTLGRSGSEYLTSLLNSHPGIHCEGELLGMPAVEPAASSDPLDFLIQHVRHARASSEGLLFGFKLPSTWLDHAPGLVDRLADAGTRFVLLHRKNRVAMYVSMRLGQINGEWTSRRHYAETTLEIDIDHMRASITAFETVDASLQDITRGRPRVMTSYEAILGDSDVPWIQDFLGVEIRSLTTRTLRARTKSLRETILNYGEVAAAFADTPYARFFDDVSDTGNGSR